MLGEVVEGKQKKRQSKNRSCVHEGMVYEAENLSWNYTKPVKKISFETQHCAILVSARSNQNVSRGLKCLKHEDTYWPIQYLRGKKNYGKIFFPRVYAWAKFFTRILVYGTQSCTRIFVATLHSADLELVWNRSLAHGKLQRAWRHSFCQH